MLVDAFRILRQMPGCRRPAARLRLARRQQRAILRRLQKKLESWGCSATSSSRMSRSRRQGALPATIDVLSVPTTYREPKGLYVLEALANGVPVVQPRHGSFPELIEATGGGLLVTGRSRRPGPRACGACWRTRPAVRAGPARARKRCTSASTPTRWPATRSLFTVATWLTHR